MSAMLKATAREPRPNLTTRQELPKAKAHGFRLLLPSAQRGAAMRRQWLTDSVRHDLRIGLARQNGRVPNVLLVVGVVCIVHVVNAVRPRRGRISLAPSFFASWLTI